MFEVFSQGVQDLPSDSLPLAKTPLAWDSMVWLSLLKSYLPVTSNEHPLDPWPLRRAWRSCGMPCWTCGRRSCKETSLPRCLLGSEGGDRGGEGGPTARASWTEGGPRVKEQAQYPLYKLGATNEGLVPISSGPGLAGRSNGSGHSSGRVTWAHRLRDVLFFLEKRPLTGVVWGN